MGVSELDRRAAAIATAEWWFFGSPYVDSDSSSGTLHTAPGAHGTEAAESKSGWEERTWTYMKQGVFPDSDSWRSKKAEPWSAAFISYVMRMAGAGDSFPYSMSHSTYVVKSALNRQANHTKNTLVAYDHDEIIPSVGDLFWRGRKSEDPAQIDTSGWTLKDVIHFTKTSKGSFPSHCDLVVKVDREANFLHLIGGNVRNRVLRMTVKIDDSGFSKGAAHKIIIKNTISE